MSEVPLYPLLKGGDGHTGTNYLHRVPTLFGRIQPENIANFAKTFVWEYQVYLAGGCG